MSWPQVMVYLVPQALTKSPTRPPFALVHVNEVKVAGFGALVQVAVAAEAEEEEVVVVTTLTGATVMEEELPVAPATLEVEDEDPVPVGLVPVARAILDI